jgi:hypothetical protein
MLSKSRMIKEANNKLDYPSNKEIKQYVKDTYKVDVMSQEIYSSIGPEKGRTSTQVTPAQMADTKRLIKRTYKGNIRAAHDAIRIIGDISNAEYRD